MISISPRVESKTRAPWPKVIKVLISRDSQAHAEIHRVIHAARYPFASQFSMRSAGIHHITAIAGDPQRNLDFYTETLGLRLVKRTVNFDDPGSYHLYFGDNIGSPGTIITFFPWPGARRGARGSGQVTTVSFAVPHNSMAFWKEQLRANHVIAEEIAGRFGSNALRFLDPDGLQLELVVIPSEVERSRRGIFKAPSTGSFDSAQDDKIFGFAAPTLEVRKPEKTENLLTEILGFEFVAEENNRRRFRGSGSNPSSEIDLVSSEAGFGQIAVGTVHHIAFRAADDDEQLRVREQLVARAQAGRDRARASHNSPPPLGRMMNDFIYRFIPGAGDRTLLLLHGTGGNENDLLPLGRAIDPDASLLSPRGKVLENGAPRFFRRLAEGIFDEKDVVARAQELANFVSAAAKKHAFDEKTLVAIGYSNGANIASAMILLGLLKFRGAILSRPMVPLSHPPDTSLENCTVLICGGRFDPIARPEQVNALAELLRDRKAEVEVRMQESGHELTDADVEAARDWLAASAIA